MSILKHIKSVNPWGGEIMGSNECYSMKTGHFKIAPSKGISIKLPSL